MVAKTAMINKFLKLLSASSVFHFEIKVFVFMILIEMIFNV